MKGTTPTGTHGEREAATFVRAMFGRVAHRYDLANHLLSFQLDRWWRARTVRRVLPVLQRPDARVLDICCGTGDLVMALQRACARPVLGSDFCHPMLVEARGKVARTPSLLFESDALSLPVRAGALDLVTVAFGFRNLANYEDGLREIRRVLRPGGMAAILEFSQPPNALFAALYGFYSYRVLPWIGGLLTGSRDAYLYLPESIRKFPDAPHLAEAMSRAGFTSVSYQRFTFGIVALHVGTV